MRNELLVGTAGTALSAFGTAMQTEQTLRIIALIVTIAGAILTYVIMPLINWYVKAKKDGKIDANEIKEGVDIIASGSEHVKDAIDKVDDEKKEGK